MLLLYIEQTTEKMDNKSSDIPYNKENEKNDEENRMVSSVNIDSSLLKEELDNKKPIENTQLHIEKEENIAENVEGVHNIKGDNGLNDNHNEINDTNRSGIDSQSLTSSASDTSSPSFIDDEYSKKEYEINRPQHALLEPSTPEELVDDWERLHHTRFSKQTRDLALKVAAIHLDKDGDSRGVTVKDIETLLGCKTIDAAEARKDR